VTLFAITLVSLWHCWSFGQSPC